MLFFPPTRRTCFIMLVSFASAGEKRHFKKKKTKKEKNHSHKLLHSDFHFADILDNGWAAGNSVWEADLQPKQIAAVDRWNEKWVDSLMLEKSQKHPDQSCKLLLIFIQKRKIFLWASVVEFLFIFLLYLFIFLFERFPWQRGMCNNFNKCQLMAFFSWQKLEGNLQVALNGPLWRFLRSVLGALAHWCSWLAFPTSGSSNSKAWWE